MENKPNFPYKTLIWALFAVLALFLFKPELKRLLTNAEKVSVFGIEISASEEQVKKLQDSIQNFEAEITNLSSQIADQENEIQSLGKLKSQLQRDLSKCPDARASSARLNTQLGKIMTNSGTLKTQSDKLKKVDILKRSFMVNQVKQ